MDKLILVVAQKDYLQRETGVLRIWSSGKHPRALIGLKVRHNSEEERKVRRPLLRQLFSQRRRADRPRCPRTMVFSVCLQIISGTKGAMMLNGGKSRRVPMGSDYY